MKHLTIALGLGYLTAVWCLYDALSERDAYQAQAQAAEAQLTVLRARCTIMGALEGDTSR